MVQRDYSASKFIEVDHIESLVYDRYSIIIEKVNVCDGAHDIQSKNFLCLNLFHFVDMVLIKNLLRALTLLKHYQRIIHFALFVCWVDNFGFSRCNFDLSNVLSQELIRHEHSILWGTLNN